MQNLHYRVKNTPEGDKYFWCCEDEKANNVVLFISVSECKTFEEQTEVIKKLGKEAFLKALRRDTGKYGDYAYYDGYTVGNADDFLS